MKKSTKIISIFYALISAASSLNAQTSDWKKETATGSPTGRDETSYTLCDSKMYLMGGRTKEPIEEYDPGIAKWVKKAALPEQLHHFQAVGLNGKVYILGAFTGGYPDEVPVSEIYVYNPQTNLVSVAGNIPAGRERGSAGAVAYNNRIYLVSGNTKGHKAGNVAYFDEYNPETGEWKTLPDVPHPRDHFNAAVAGNRLYVVSGRQSAYPNTFNNTVAEVDVYDFTTGTWSTLSANLPTPRAGAGVVAYENEILVIGGESMAQTAAHNETEALNTTTNTWRILPDLQTGRHGTQAVAYNGRIYIASGVASRGGTPTIADQEILDFETISLGITKSETGNFKAFPNPFSSNLIINSSEHAGAESLIEIYDMTGKLRYQTQFVTGQSLNLEDVITNGIYMARVVVSGEIEDKIILRKE
jgi:large repetitive protein